jgi:hypothetical protein
MFFVVPSAIALGYDRAEIPACPEGESLTRVMGRVVCTNTKSVRREDINFYEEQKNAYSPTRVTPRTVRPFQTRVSDVRSTRARRAVATYYHTGDDKKEMITRIKEEQRASHCKRRPQDCSK